MIGDVAEEGGGVSYKVRPRRGRTRAPPLARISGRSAALFFVVFEAWGKVWLRPRQTLGDIHLILFEKLLVQSCHRVTAPNKANLRPLLPLFPEDFFGGGEADAVLHWAGSPRPPAFLPQSSGGLGSVGRERWSLAEDTDFRDTGPILKRKKKWGPSDVQGWTRRGPQRAFREAAHAPR